MWWKYGGPLNYFVSFFGAIPPFVYDFSLLDKVGIGKVSEQQKSVSSVDQTHSKELHSKAHRAADARDEDVGNEGSAAFLEASLKELFGPEYRWTQPSQ